ncbi:hypothetical protein D3C87_1430890 [compost metagenome]
MTFGHIGFTNAGKHVMGITRSIILNGDGDILRIVVHGHGHFFPRIVHAVFDEIAQPVNNAGIPDANRLVDPVVLFDEIETDAEFPVRRHHLLNQRGERQAAHMLLIIGGKRCEAAQNITASFALAAQQRYVFAKPFIISEFPFHFLGDDADCRQRRAQLVCRSGGQTV